MNKRISGFGKESPECPLDDEEKDMKANKTMKKAISLALTATLAVSLLAPWAGTKSANVAEAAEESSNALDLTQYLNIYDNFDSYETGSTYTLDGPTDYGSAATASIETRDGSDRWLKLSGNSGTGHAYAQNGYAREDFFGAIDDYNGVAFYVKTESVATFNLQMIAGYWGRTRTETNSDLDYTLVSAKNGKATTAKGSCGVPLDAEFEGWIIIGYDELTAAGGYSNTAFAGIKNEGNSDLKWINVMTAEITGASGAVYVDNMSFVKDCSTFISALEEALAPPPSVYDYLNVYENFEGFDLGTSSYLTDGDYGIASASEVLESDATGNKWLKIDGENHGWHVYADDNCARNDFSGKISKHDGVALYVHTDASATLNLIFKAGYQGVTRTATNSELDYTLVSKDGVKTVAKGNCGVPLAAGFEGWVIIGYSHEKTMKGSSFPFPDSDNYTRQELTAAGGWNDALSGIENVSSWNENLGFLNKMAVEITNTTKPVYVDNISFVTSTTDMINFLAPEVPSADDYLVVYEDFEGFASGDSYTMGYTDADGGELVADAIIAKKTAGNKWLKLSGNNRAGHQYTTPRTEFSLSKDACQGVAVYVKTEQDATFNVLLSKQYGGLTRTNNNADLDYTLIASDGATTSAKGAKGIPLKAGYEGWVLIEKAELTNAEGWPAGALDAVTDMNQIDVFTFEITDTTGPVYVDNLSFITDMEALVQILHVAYPSEFVTCYEDFNGYAEGKSTYALDDRGNDFFENKTNATATIEARGDGDKWLKISGNNNVGHIYGTNNEGNPNYGWPRKDFSADSTKYAGVSLYAKTEFAATLNLRLRIGYSYISRTATNGSLTYTLVPKDGEPTTLTETNGISLPAGFEGTVILRNDALTAAGGYTSVHEYLASADNKDLNQLNEFAAEITNTNGIVYLDNYAFVTDVDAYIASFANVSKTYGTGDLNKDHGVGDYDVMLERKFLVTDDAKMLQLDGNNGAGVALPSGENAKNPSGLSYDGFAVKLQTDSDVKLNLVLRYQKDVTGQYRTGYVSQTHDPKDVNYTLVSKHGSKLEKTTNGGMIIPANFDGWLVFGKEEMGNNPGWGDLEFPSTDVTGFTYLFPQVTNVTDAIDFRIGSFAFAKDKEGLVNALAAGTSYGSYLGVIEDLENKSYGTFSFDEASIDGNTSGAAIVASGNNSWKEYDLTQDDAVDSRDLVHIKRMAGGVIEETPIVFEASELVKNMSVWNTPGLAKNKDFQFDIESDSTWISVTGADNQTDEDKAGYLNALNYHNVGETTSLLPTKSAREWGYALTHLDGEHDGAGHSIDTMGYTSTDKPTTDAEALAKMKAFIQKQWSITDSTDWYSLNGYYPWNHYAAEFGARVISTEIGEAQNNYQMHTAFARGAGRQYGKTWGIDFSMWHGGYMYNPNGYSGWDKSGVVTTTKTDANCGHSMSLLERSLLMGYMSGANSVVAEAGGAMSLLNNNGNYELTEYGKTVRKVYQFTEKTDIGTAYTPVGIVLDYNHGSYAGIRKSTGIGNEAEKSFFTFDYTDGDQMTKKLAEMIWGTDAWMSGSKRSAKKEADAMVNNEEYGDSFDILLQNADIDVLKSYPVLLLSGEITLSAEELQSYKQYVNDGGTLLLNKAYTTQFGVVSSRAYGAGQYIVYGSSDYDLTGLDAILKEQIAKYQPVSIEGNIQYMTSVKDNTIYVALINNEGVTKTGSAAATTDASKASSVTVTYTGKYGVASATDIYNSLGVTLSGKAATVTVPAGGIAVLEISLK